MKLLMDLTTGEPIVDFKGDILLTDMTRSFRQYLDVMFRTPIFEEVSLPTWGLPVKEIFQLRFDANWENMVKYFFAQMLNPRFEPIVDEVRSIKVERDGSALDVTVHAVSKYGTETINEVVFNE